MKSSQHSSSLSVRHFDELWVGQADESAVTFDRYLPEPFRSEHERARATAEEQVIGQLPKQHGIMWTYAPTRVSVQARSHQEALETSLEVLDLLRGVWNVALNRTVEIRSSFGIRKPVNRLVLGPVHSLHNPDGYLVDQSPWIEDDYVGALGAYNLKPEWTYVQEYEHFVWQELLKVPYRRDLEASIRRYARALDRRDWNSSFVRLWGLLETLTATHNHKKVTARVLPLVKDEHKDFHRQILKHLNGYRNRTVHAGHETVAAEILLYQLKFYAEKLLEFHLSALPAFDSVNEATLFLDSATEADVSRRLSGQ
jgi:hypothetical protein